MESAFEIFETLSSSDTHDECFMQIIKACEDHKALALKPHNRIQPIVGHINRKLNSPSSRADGLQLLKALLPQCSDEVFSENATSWMAQCVKGIEGHAKQKTGQISYETLKLLLESAAQLQELTKPVATTVVPKILDLLQNTTHQVSYSALQCLEVLLRNFGGPCGPNKVAVERFVLSFVDDDNSVLVHAAGRCVALFPLMGGGGTGSLNHRSAWLSLQQQLCAAMSEVLDDLFENITEIQSFHGVAASSHKLSIPEITEANPSLVVYRMTRRFINLSRFLQCMFRAEFPVAKAVLPDLVLSLVCRGLAVTSKTLGKKISNEKLALSLALPQIHLALLKVVRSLIACCGSTLLQYGSLICKLVAQTLKWTAVNVWCYGMDKPYGKLRVEACNTLVDWLVCSKTGSCVELHADLLVSLLRSEVLSARPTVTLSVHKTPGKHLSKQQRKMMNKKQNSQSAVDCDACDSDTASGRSRLVDRTANRELCRAALRALQWIIKAGGLFIQPSLHKSLQETVLLLLLDVQQASGPTEYPPPYSVPVCRLELYSLLVTLTLESHPSWAAPTQYALRVLATGQTDSNLLVAAFCTSALSSIRSLVHPTCPSLDFPKSVEEMEESVAASTQNISCMQNGDVCLQEDSSAVESGGEEEATAAEEQSKTQAIREQENRKRNRSPDNRELNKRRKAENREVPSSKNNRRGGRDQEITVDSGDGSSSNSDDVREVFRIGKTVGTERRMSDTVRTGPSPEMFEEGEYFVEEVDDNDDGEEEESTYRTITVHQGKGKTCRYRVDTKPSTMGNREVSPVRIVELVESFEYELQEQHVTSQERVDGGSGDVSTDDSQHGIIDLGSDDADSSGKRERSRSERVRDEIRCKRHTNKELSRQTSKGSETICIGDETEDGESTSVEASDIEEIDLSKDDEIGEEEYDDVSSDEADKNQPTKSSSQNDESTTLEINLVESENSGGTSEDDKEEEEEENDEEEVEEYEENNESMTGTPGEQPAKSNLERIDKDTVDITSVESENSGSSSKGEPLIVESEDLAKEEDNVSQNEVATDQLEQSDTKSTEKCTVEINLVESENSGSGNVGDSGKTDVSEREESCKETVRRENDAEKEECTEPDMQKETPVTEGKSDAVQTASEASILNKEDCPSVKGSSEMEIDDDDMLASFVDVVKPEVVSSEVVQSTTGEKITES
ncbi:proline-, glutamic acid- and leucine-rich protein 1 [Anabrus simplex]|uniref:proline-, glutamic acid- and leucine-rich protein 1 n=1 Tax=Anabrus simplex TaxID=316456 RepID=UPI0035A3C839